MHIQCVSIDCCDGRQKQSENAAARRGAAGAPNDDLSCCTSASEAHPASSARAAAAARAVEVVHPPCCSSRASSSSSSGLGLAGQAVVVGDLLPGHQVHGGADEHARARRRGRCVSGVAAALPAAAGLPRLPLPARAPVPAAPAPADQLREAVGSARVVDEPRPAALHRRVDDERRAATGRRRRRRRRQVAGAVACAPAPGKLLVFSAATAAADGPDTEEVDAFFTCILGDETRARKRERERGEFFSLSFFRRPRHTVEKKKAQRARKILSPSPSLA